MKWVSPTCSIAVNTFREAMRAKLLWAVVLISCLALATVTLLGMVTIGDQIKVLRDFGLTIMSLASVGYASIVGATLLEKELAKKTVFNILSRPVPRWNFITGKFLGLWITVVTVAATIGCIVAVIAAILGDNSVVAISSGFFFIALEGLILAACVLFFSTILVTPSLAGLLTLAAFIVGRSSEYLLRFIERGEFSGIGRLLIQGIYWSIPNFAFLNVSDQITFGTAIEIEMIFKSIVYSVSYSVTLLLLASILFERRDFN